MNGLPAVQFPRCSIVETRILQLRARGYSFRDIERDLGIAPRRASDMYFAAMAKIINYLEQDAFLNSKAPRSNSIHDVQLW